ncbi:alpha-glucosidase [Halanaerobium sp. Z-7514]|uniref:Alpha-glucosidase n=1 Tax=Halanaerobium polyolivorans TaxID=2886943 RepID=A0AAW4X1D3_9FIRM|nr:alpha-glucosidase [Halanaerobium polyolivorans]MCC3145603.1 alpha-glucosidase [Halanaerobium polyolivorans]
MKKKWWKEAVVYQIYPRSFNDSNNDGIGDLNGITEKLDYLLELGVDVLWLTPINKSPNYDNGYDISDYKKVMDEFGTLSDFKNLISEAEKKGLKVIIDLVMNHTSYKHKWFKDSKKKKNNKSDYYIWKKEIPNNWRSFFSGSAWEYEEERGEYYLHLYAKEQADLNWENNEVKDEFKKIMKWWLDLGVSGFRLDAIHHLAKEQDFSDIEVENIDDESQLFSAPQYTHREKVHKILNEFNNEIFNPNNLLTVGEIGYADLETSYKYTATDRKEVSMVVQFDHLNLSDFKKDNLKKMKKIQKDWYNKLFEEAWIVQYLESHDQPRSLSKYGDLKYRDNSAKLLATLLLTSPGTPFIYQGEEIGMTNVNFNKIDEYDDIKMKNKYNELIERGLSEDKFFDELKKKSRDNARTPMQWNNKENAGFSDSTPWLKVNSNYKKINVENNLKNNKSILKRYQNLIELRKKHKDCLVYGKYEDLLEENKDIHIYKRKCEDKTILIILNFTRKNINLEKITGDLILLDNYEFLLSDNKDKRTLFAFESMILINKLKRGEKNENK